MSWVVCRFKDDNSLFVNSRKAREVMINVLQDLGQEIESIVLKEFDSFEKAMKYKKEMEEVDNKLNDIL